MQITKTICIALRADLEAALADIGKKYGIQLSTGKIRYDNDSISIPVNGNAIPDGVDANDAEAVARASFAKLAHYYGGEADWYGRKIRLDGKDYTIVGVNERAKKNAFVIECAGNRYVCSAATIRESLI